jgi:hypothetical protein
MTSVTSTGRRPVYQASQPHAARWRSRGNAPPLRRPPAVLKAPTTRGSSGTPKKFPTARQPGPGAIP